MFHPLSLYIGLRYARARAHRYFVSFITWVSLAGVSVGVAALIVILSVMNGFESELRDRLLALSAPLRITAPGEANPDWPRLREEVAASLPGARVERYAELQVLAEHQPEATALTLRGADEYTRAELADFLVQGEIGPLESEQGIVLGVLVADKLGVAPGDTVKLLVLAVTGGELPEPKLREFVVAGLFEAGIQDHDGRLGYVSMDVMSGLGAARSRAEGVNIRLDDALAAPAAAQELRARLAPRWRGLKVTDWTEDHASYFRAIRIEKTMMALILLLIVAVAAFNIVAMLVMVVTDKRTDIAILRTLGASPRSIAGAFVAQGLVIGWMGVASGVLLGVLVAANVGPILDFLYAVAGLSLFDPEVYYISEVPSELHAMDVVLVAGSALLLTVLATIYPALRAAGTSPAEALRYE
jgi:lipoprotein-releasing system permease protein